MANEKTIKEKMRDAKTGYIYRIYTENINRGKLEKLTGEYFEGFTVINAVGYWQGIKEKSVIIEIIGDRENLGKIKELATHIKINNKQSAVLIQIEKNRRVMI